MTMLPLSAWVARELKSQGKWLIDGCLRPGDLVEIVEEAKGGKTTFVVQLLSALLMGKPFLGQQTVRTRVAYLGTEDRAEDLQEMFKVHSVDPNQILTDRDLTPYTFPSPGDKRLLKIIKQHKVGVIVLDPITDFIQLEGFGRDGFDENDATHWKRIMDALTQTAKKTHAVIIFTRHKSKGMSGKRGARSVGAARGSNYPETKVQVVMNLTKYQSGWKLFVQGKGIQQKELWLISPRRYVFAVSPQSRTTLPTNGSKKGPINHKGQHPAAAPLRAFVQDHGGRVSGHAIMRECKRLRDEHGKGFVPMRGDAFKKILGQAGITTKRSGGSSVYMIPPHDRKVQAA